MAIIFHIEKVAAFGVFITLQVPQKRITKKGTVKVTKTIYFTEDLIYDLNQYKGN